MATLSISKELLERLEAIAEREHQNIEGLLSEFVEKYELPEPVVDLENWHDPLEAIVGILDTGETDLSTTVRETLAKHTHPSVGGQ